MAPSLPTSGIRTPYIRNALALLLVAAVLASAFLTTAAIAQTEAEATTPPTAPPSGEPRFYGGAHLLFSNSNVSGTEEYDPRMGLGGGVYVGGSAWKSFDLRLEANYVQKGANLSVGNWTIEWQMDYLEIPLLLVYNVMPRSETSFEMCAGVAYGFSVQEQVEEGSNLGYDLEAVIDEFIPLEQTGRTGLVINSVETTDLSFLLGAGLSVPVGAVNLCFDVRYTVGLTDPVVDATFQQLVGEDDDVTVVSTHEAFSNKTFCFFVGFEFPFGVRNASSQE